MKWKTELSENGQIVKLKFYGLISTQELYSCSKEVIELANKHNVLSILVDAIKFKFESPKADIFRMPAALYNEWGMNRLMKIAVIEPQDLSATSIANFYEIATTNLGWNAKVFPNIKAALKWLSEA